MSGPGRSQEHSFLSLPERSRKLIVQQIDKELTPVPVGEYGKGVRDGLRVAIHLAFLCGDDAEWCWNVFRYFKGIDFEAGGKIMTEHHNSPDTGAT